MARRMLWLAVCQPCQDRAHGPLLGRQAEGEADDR